MDVGLCAGAPGEGGREGGEGEEICLFLIFILNTSTPALRPSLLFSLPSLPAGRDKGLGPGRLEADAANFLGIVAAAADRGQVRDG